MSTAVLSPSSLQAQDDKRQRWWPVLLALLVVTLLVPLLNLALPEAHPLHVSDYLVTLLGKMQCFALCALALDLVWGVTGILSLGHGLFFALGAYAMGMALMVEAAGPGNLPAFMVFLDWKSLPWHWSLSGSILAQLLLVLLVPGLLAGLFGYFAFRSRIKGVYFSIITQALTFAAMLLFFRNETGFGGNNGFTDFKTLAGIPLADPRTRLGLFVLTGCVLIAAYLLARWIVASKFGRLLQAVRDAENRVMFTGYDPLRYKLAVWVLSALMCGVAGALYVLQVGIINPSEMSTAASIEMAVWVAVGGRATLIGPIMGAFFVNGTKSVFTVVWPEAWLFVLGGLFIVVTLFMPQGLVGLFKSIKAKFQTKDQSDIQAEVKA